MFVGDLRRHLSLFFLLFLSGMLLLSLNCSPTPTTTGESSSKTEQASSGETTTQETTGTTDAGTTPDSAAPDTQVQPDTTVQESPKEQTPTEQGKLTKCENDCDCIGLRQVCEAKSGGTQKYCSGAERAPQCPNCSSPICPTGKPCLQRDGNIGKCPLPTKCKHDCDCIAKGLLCDGTVCRPLQRVGNCKSCDGGACKKGEPCQNADKSIGTCQPDVGKACKHDCDCWKYSLVCENAKCAAIRRVSKCLECSDKNCKAGEPCRKPDKTIDKCSTPPTPCKHDCDCFKIGQVCHQNKCAPLKRASLCLPCQGGTCKTGDPCHNPDKSIGTCITKKACKDDCDCPPSLACGGGFCAPLSSRKNNCPKCTDVTCPRGKRCWDSSGKIGVCCCNVSGCGKGLVCCPGGVKPPPGTCGFTCDPPGPNGQCIPKP